MWLWSKSWKQSLGVESHPPKRYTEILAWLEIKVMLPQTKYLGLTEAEKERKDPPLKATEGA